MPLLSALLWPGVVAPDRALSMGQTKLNCIVVLLLSNWNRTVLTFSCVWTKSVLILNWIVWIGTIWLNLIAWNRNVFDY